MTSWVHRQKLMQLLPQVGTACVRMAGVTRLYAAREAIEVLQNFIVHICRYRRCRLTGNRGAHERGLRLRRIAAYRASKHHDEHLGVHSRTVKGLNAQVRKMIW